MKRYQAIISYDGTTYFGWQKTKAGPSIQEILAQAIRKISPESILPEAASRTDRGVHAEGQSVAIDVDADWKPNLLKNALNAHLPRDIRITQVLPASPDFHPTLEAISKEYHYRLCLGPVQNPIDRLYSWAVQHPRGIDLQKIEKAAQDFVGTWDFSALTSQSYTNPICTIYAVQLNSLPNERLEIAISGTRFLYKMARTMIGTLIYIGCGKLPPDCIHPLLMSKDRRKAGLTAPPHGLTLFKVNYSASS